MAKESMSGPPSGEKFLDKGVEWWRKINKVTATAFAGAGVVLYAVGQPEVAAVSFGLAAIDVAQNGIGKYIQNRRAKGKGLIPGVT